MPVASASSPSPLIQSARELELESEIEALRARLVRLVVDLAAARAHLLEESEPEIVRFALTIAERVVGRELSTEPELVLSWVREGLAVLPGRAPPVVAVAPDVAAAIPEGAFEGVVTEGSIVVDAALGPGTCELREGSSSVRIGGGERLAAISDALGLDREG